MKNMVLIFVLLVGFENPSVIAARPPKVKLATLVPKGTSFHQILLEMGEKWRDAPDGGVTLKIYPDGTMGGEADMVRRMRVGQIQAGMLSVDGLAEIDDSVSALQNMPMMFRTLDEVDYVREKLHTEIEGKFLEKGFIVLFWGDAGWVRFFSRAPAENPEDFKKLKLFAWAGDNDQIDIMKAGGYQPVPLEPTDILTSLQTGLIDGVASTPFYALAGQFYRPAPHMLDLNWVPLVGGTVIVKKVWDKLSPATRESLMVAAAQAGDQVKERSRAESLESIEAMEKRGLIIHKLDPETKDAWRKVAESTYPKIRGKIVPSEMFDKVQRLLVEYRSSSTKTDS